VALADCRPSDVVLSSFAASGTVLNGRGHGVERRRGRQPGSGLTSLGRQQPRGWEL